MKGQIVQELHILSIIGNLDKMVVATNSALPEENPFAESQKKFTPQPATKSTQIREKADTMINKCADIFFNLKSMPGMHVLKPLGNGKIYAKPCKLVDPNSIEMGIEINFNGFTAPEVCEALFDINSRKVWQKEFDDLLELVEDYDEATKIILHVTKKIILVSKRATLHATHLKKVPFERIVELSGGDEKDREEKRAQSKSNSDVWCMVSFDVDHENGNKKLNDIMKAKKAIKSNLEVFIACQTQVDHTDVDICSMNAKEARKHIRTKFVYFTNTHFGGMVPNFVLSMQASLYAPKFLTSADNFLNKTYKKRNPKFDDSCQ